MKKEPNKVVFEYGKVPPQAPELEDAVLGALMLEADKIDDVISIIPTHEVFYKPESQLLYEAFLQMIEAGKRIDMLTVTEQLRNNGTLEQIGGSYYLVKLTMSVVSSAHVTQHAIIIREKWERREMIRIYSTGLQMCYDDSCDDNQLIVEMVEQQTGEVIHKGSLGGSTHVAIAYKEMLAGIEAAQGKDEFLSGADTGLSELNRITNGWQDTDLIILGARPGAGKTALALNCAYSAATSNDTPKRKVLFFSLEMSKRQLLQRIASRVTGVPFENIKRSNPNMYQLQSLIAGQNSIASVPIWIDDRAGLSISQVRAKAKSEKKKHGIDFIVIDYLQLMRGTKSVKGANREQEIAEVSRELKSLAKELELPIIALSQLNRNVEGRKDPKPTKADLRESGSIEQDADLILFIYHPEDPMNPQNLLNMISVAKHRNGSCEDIEAKFIGYLQKWVDKDAFAPQDETGHYQPFAGMPNKFSESEEKLPW